MLLPGFQINVLPPKGGLPLRSFTDLPSGLALKDGFFASLDPLTGCNELVFQGRPDFAGLEGGEILEAFINWGGLKPVFYGAVIVGDTTDPAPEVSAYTGNARALLMASVVPGVRFKNMDTAAIAYAMALAYKHPAVKLDPANFPASGTVLDSFRALGQLGDVLDDLLELTEDKACGSGLGPDGHLFFKANRLTRTASYEDSDYDTLPLSGAALTTATIWTLTADSLSDYAGPYLPGVLSYQAVPDAELHDRYGYTRIRDIPAAAFQAIPDSPFTSSGFTNPANAVTVNAATAATRQASGAGTFTIPNADPLVYGVRLIYRLSDAAGSVKFRATAGSIYFEKELQKSDLDKPVDFFLPPHEGPFTLWSQFRLSAASGGTFELVGFFPLRLNTAFLDGITKLVVPERRPGQIVEKGIKDNAATIVMPDTPRGRQESPSAGIRYVWSPDSEPETITDLETSAYDADDPALQKVSGYYRRK